MLLVRSPSTASTAVAPGSCHVDFQVTFTMSTAAPVAVSAARPAPRITSFGGVVSGGGTYVRTGVLVAAAVAALLVDVLLELAADDPVDRGRKQSPCTEQADRSGHQRSGVAHLQRTSHDMVTAHYRSSVMTAGQ